MKTLRAALLAACVLVVGAVAAHALGGGPVLGGQLKVQWSPAGGPIDGTSTGWWALYSPYDWNNNTGIPTFYVGGHLGPGGGLPATMALYGPDGSQFTIASPYSGSGGTAWTIDSDAVTVNSGDWTINNLAAQAFAVTNQFTMDVNGGSFKRKMVSGYADSHSQFLSARHVSTGAGATTVGFGGGANLPDNCACVLNIDVTARHASNTHRAAYTITASVYRVAGVAVLQGQTAVATVESDAAWNATIGVNGANSPAMLFTGVAATTIYWAANGEMTCVRTDT